MRWRCFRNTGELLMLRSIAALAAMRLEAWPHAELGQPHPSRRTHASQSTCMGAPQGGGGGRAIDSTSAAKSLDQHRAQRARLGHLAGSRLLGGVTQFL